MHCVVSLAYIKASRSHMNDDKAMHGVLCSQLRKTSHLRSAFVDRCHIHDYYNRGGGKVIGHK